MNFKLRLGGKGVHPQELTQVSDWGDKSAGSRFERCLQRPVRAWPTDGPRNRTQTTTQRLERRWG
ncbi:hypothetical protein DMW62_22550 [Serratia marcescens]|uniref:Addiction module toxin RelE n=1 Tax=Serratia marcescens TaxID=615 RepID=A0ABX5NB75_SERMA|nr:hypothetical protein MC51_020040 [Serratia marcescens]AUY16245.1 hypothetical protein C3F38_21630 [Serratia sp. SSNIH1]POU54354.1 hypothetical protein C3401_11410 [Serratia sp. SSNIH4]POW37715.1 hypothetical protein C3396_13340 [Serratia sp. SSNIH5]POW38894.1 hypothetical protein C3414_12500 [Serratia sp. SSNIH2]POW61274.1 hypothetical protein C3403_12015 [Serratia sp. SSNIH3]